MEEEVDLLLRNITTEVGSVLKAKAVVQEGTGVIPTRAPTLQHDQSLTEAVSTITQVDAKAHLVFQLHHAVRLVVEAQIQEAPEVGRLVAQVDPRHEVEITKRIQR